MNAMVPAATRGDIIETVLLKGDLAKLTPQERSDYYLATCKSVGLNPLTRPFEYITLNGKLMLYARKDCTDQLRSIHNISVEEMTETEREGVFIVTTKVQNAAGRRDIAKGAVPILGLKGEGLANALMKAETKSKRRATLAICGLGMLDETEVEDASFARPVPSATARPVIPSPDAEPEASQEDDSVTVFMDKCRAHLETLATEQAVKDWWASDDLGKVIAALQLPQERVDIIKAWGMERRKAIRTASGAPQAVPNATVASVAPVPQNAQAASPMAPGPYAEGDEAVALLESNYTEGVQAIETWLWTFKGKEPSQLDAAWEATIEQLDDSMLLPPDRKALQGARRRILGR